MTSTLEARLDTIFDRYRRSGGPGCTVVVRVNGDIVHRAAYGLASVEHGVANRLATPMPIGSVTKQFTCAALLLLVDDGIVALDDPIGRWVTGLASSTREPTLRELMTHTGGVRCYLDSWMFNGYRTMPVGYGTDFQRRQQCGNFAPGEAAVYSNGGYLLLSLAIENAAGEALESYLARRVFAPLGMHATRLPRRRWPVRPDVATLYSPVDGGANGWRHAVAMADEMLGDGGMVSTADDLLRWAQSLREASLGISIDRLTGSPTLVDGEAHYGFGVITEHWRGVRVVQHTGAMPGASTILMTLPDERLDLTILCNCNAPVVELGQRIVATVLGSRLAAVRPAPLAADHAELIGDYLGEDFGFLFGFVDIDGRLELSIFGGTPFELTTIDARGDESPFSADVGTGGMRFRTAATDGRRVTRVDYLDGGTWRSAKRRDPYRNSVQEVVPDPSTVFACDDSEATLHFETIGSEVVARFRGAYGAADCRTEPIDANRIRLVSPEFGSGLLATFERNDDVITAVVVSTPRTRRMTFVRR